MSDALCTGHQTIPVVGRRFPALLSGVEVESNAFRVDVTVILAVVDGTNTYHELTFHHLEILTGLILDISAASYKVIKQSINMYFGTVRISLQWHTENGFKCKNVHHKDTVASCKEPNAHSYGVLIGPVLFYCDSVCQIFKMWLLTARRPFIMYSVAGSHK